MNNDFFVNIEEHDMPYCEFNYPDLDEKEKSNAGFINFIYLFSFVCGDRFCSAFILFCGEFTFSVSLLPQS